MGRWYCRVRTSRNWNRSRVLTDSIQEHVTRTRIKIMKIEEDFLLETIKKYDFDLYNYIMDSAIADAQDRLKELDFCITNDYTGVLNEEISMWHGDILIGKMNIKYNLEDHSVVIEQTS